MRLQAIPRELAFFDLFDRSSACAAAGADRLLELAGRAGETQPLVDAIKVLEVEADGLTRDTMRLLARTFAVPIDRADIHRMAIWIDDVVDAEEHAAELYLLYGLVEPIAHLRPLVEVLARSTRYLCQAIAGLRHMDVSAAVVQAIRREEREGDWVYRRAIMHLYSGSYSALDVLKWKDVLDAVERATDRCEDIADALESIMVKFA